MRKLGQSKRPEALEDDLIPLFKEVLQSLVLRTSLKELSSLYDVQLNLERFHSPICASLPEGNFTVISQLATLHQHSSKHTS